MVATSGEDESGSGADETSGVDPSAGDDDDDDDDTGDDDDDTGDDDDDDPPEACDVDVGVTPLLRLTPRQYANVVRDLVGVEVDVGALDPAEKVGPFDTNVSTPVTAATVDQYRALAEEIAWSVDLEPLLPCALGDGDAACREAFVATIGRRAFRRSLDEEEGADYVSLAESEPVFEDGIRLVLQALLQSPHFLYRLEIAPAGASGEVVALTDDEVASRLSFFLWNAAPDDALLDAAQAGDLGTPQGLRAEATRMLDDPRARTVVGDFHLQWLELDAIELVTKDPAYYPDWNAELHAAMLVETRRFAESVVLHGDGRLATLLSASTSYLDDALFEHYDVPQPEGHSPGVPVALPEDQRAGLLTHASFLAAHAHPNQSGPVQRGVVVRTNILCQPPPPPPADAMVVPPDPEPDATTREIFEQHTADPACAGCHVLIDGIGLGFEGYDGVGAYRETQNGQPVDQTGVLAGTDVDGEFDGAVELAHMLAESQDVADCVTRQWVRFALGRAEAEADECSIATLQAEFDESGHDLRALIVDLVASDAFRHRIAP